MIGIVRSRWRKRMCTKEYQGIVYEPVCPTTATSTANIVKYIVMLKTLMVDPRICQLQWVNYKNRPVLFVLVWPAITFKQKYLYKRINTHNHVILASNILCAIKYNINWQETRLFLTIRYKINNKKKVIAGCNASIP